MIEPLGETARLAASWTLPNSAFSAVKIRKGPPEMFLGDSNITRTHAYFVIKTQKLGVLAHKQRHAKSKIITALWEAETRLRTDHRHMVCLLCRIHRT